MKAKQGCRKMHGGHDVAYTEGERAVPMMNILEGSDMSDITAEL